MEKNLKLANSLNNNDDFDYICEHRKIDMDKKSRVFDFWKEDSVDCFMPEKSKFAAFLKL